MGSLAAQGLRAHRHRWARTSRWSRWVLVALTATMATLAWTAAPQAGAASIAPAPGLSRSFAELGLAPSYTFAGNGSSVGITLPRLTAGGPSEVAGTMIVPPDFGTGSVVVLSGSTYVSSFPLPRRSDREQVVPVLLPLAGVAVTGSTMALTIAIQQAGGGVAYATQQGTCGGSGILPLTFTDLRVRYRGPIVTSTTVATFFPAVLTSLTIYVPPNPTSAESQAALQLALGVTSAYAMTPTTVAVEAWSGSAPPAPPADLLARSIVIETARPTGLTLWPGARGQVLVVAGSAATLVRQTTLLLSPLVGVVQSTQGAVTAPIRTPVLPVGKQTFSQLGLSGAVTFAGTQRIDLGLSETALGGVVASMAIDLRAHYSPLEAGAKGEVEVGVAGAVLAAQALSNSGALELPFTIPSALVTRVTALTVTVSYFPASFTCTGITRTMAFTVDPRSTVIPAIDAGAAGGFPSLPQALVPTFEVALATPSASELGAAVQTLCGIQRLASVPLHPTVVSLASALQSAQPLVVVGTAASLAPSFTPPLGNPTAGTFVVHRAGGGQFTMDAPVAAVEVFADVAHSRPVVEVTTTSTWALADRLFAWLGTSPARWASLSGDVVATSSVGTPVNLTIAAGGPQVFLPDAAGASAATLVAVGLFCLVLVALLLWLALLLSRRRSSTR